MWFDGTKHVFLWAVYIVRVIENPKIPISSSFQIHIEIDQKNRSIETAGSVNKANAFSTDYVVAFKLNYALSLPF